ncbi:MAG: hypothetical protein AAGG08_21795, partial [Actinomycetota bacterium]
ASYEAERLPVARNNCEQSLTNAMKMLHLAGALGLDTDPTTEQVLRAVADDSRTESIAAAVELQEEHFDLEGLQLGYVYDGAAVVIERNGADLTTPRQYVPTARPGARLPHAWIDGEGGRSTLDLIDLSVPTLVSFGDHDAWGRSIPLDAAISHVRLDVDQPAPVGWRELCGVEPTGALLVRPDQHVAFRAPDASFVGRLAGALDVVAGRS